MPRLSYGQGKKNLARGFTFTRLNRKRCGAKAEKDSKKIEKYTSRVKATETILISFYSL